MNNQLLEARRRLRWTLAGKIAGLVLKFSMVAIALVMAYRAFFIDGNTELALLWLIFANTVR
jgi:hypothetical protein